MTDPTHSDQPADQTATSLPDATGGPVELIPLDASEPPDRPVADRVSSAGVRGGPSLGNRLAVYVAAALVIVLGGGGLFASGFLLGRQTALSPGGSDTQQTLFQPFWDTYNDITTNYVGTVDQHALVEGAIKGLFGALGDPFSFYMTEEEYQASLSSISGEFEGIGASMTTQDSAGNSCDTISDSCLLTVVQVIRGSPALRAGLLAGDVIVAVDGQSLAGSTVSDAVDVIRGPKGSQVTLSLLRNGQPMDMSITRDTIVQEDVSSQLMAGGQLGYIKINEFSTLVGSDLASQLSDLLGQHVRGIILDLRDDPGGYVDQARQVASQFVGTPPLYWEQSAGAEPIAQDPLPGGVATDPSLPVIVLVNGGTASASEIVAGSLQGNHRAQLVGQQTYGKGTIQEWKPLAGAGGYRLSVRKWLTPDQTWINGVGLTPDVKVDVPSDTPAGSDPILDRAIQLLTNSSAQLEGLPLAA
jgi:carboxyl-terminal processing protease